MGKFRDGKGPVSRAKDPGKTRKRNVTTDEIANRKALFIESMRQYGIVTVAADYAGITRQSAHKWRRLDKAFAAQWKEAKSISFGLLEKAANERARVGWEEEVYGKGGYVGTRKRYSDTILMFLMKAGNKKRYGDSHTVQQNISGSLGVRKAGDLTKEELLAIVQEGKANGKIKNGDGE